MTRFAVRQSALGASICAVLAISAPSSTAAAPAEKDALLETGEAALEGGDLIGAIKAFQAALELGPDGWQAHDGMGRAWRAAGDLESAQRELRLAVSLAPDSRAAHHLAELNGLLREGKHRREAWRWLGEHATGTLEIQLSVAREARRAGDLKTAGKALERALRLDPGHMTARIDQIRVHRDRLDYAGAEELARAFILQHPRYAETYVQLGRIYQVQARLEEASESYEKGLELAPEHATALHRLGEIKMTQDDLDGALDLLKRSVTAAPDRYQPHYLLGQVYLRRGDRQSATRELEIFRRIKDAQRAQTRLAGGASMELD